MEISLIPFLHEDWGNALGGFTQSAEATWLTEGGGWDGDGGGSESWVNVYFGHSSVFFHLKASWKPQKLPDSTTPPTGQYGPSLALTAATRSTDPPFKYAVMGCHGKSTVRINHSSDESAWVWAALITIFPPGYKPICLILSTTKFPISHWQNGSGPCLRNRNENNFF